MCVGLGFGLGAVLVPPTVDGAEGYEPCDAAAEWCGRFVDADGLGPVVLPAALPGSLIRGLVITDGRWPSPATDVPPSVPTTANAVPTPPAATRAVSPVTAITRRDPRSPNSVWVRS